MKKFLVTILAFVYLTATVGVTLQQHYCMDKLVGWSFFDHKNDMCPSCGMNTNDEDNNGCCKDQHFKVKISDDQQASFVDVVFQHPEQGQGAAFFIYHQHLIYSPAQQYFADHGPPYIQQVPVFLLNGVFRI